MYTKLIVEIHNRTQTPLQIREAVHKLIHASQLLQYASDLDVEIATHSGKCSQEHCGRENNHEDHES